MTGKALGVMGKAQGRAKKGEERGYLRGEGAGAGGSDLLTDAIDRSVGGSEPLVGLSILVRVVGLVLRHPIGEVSGRRLERLNAGDTVSDGGGVRVDARGEVSG